MVKKANWGKILNDQLPTIERNSQRDEDMASLTPRMEALMEQLNMSDRGPTMGAFIMVNPYLYSAYNPVALPLLSQATNSRGTMASFRGNGGRQSLLSSF